MIERMIMAGWGGQGLMTLGKLIANVGMLEGLEVTYFPSYGAEVRGGTANCQVILSNEPIYSPIVEHANSLVVMNQPSYDRFRPQIVDGGLLVLNSSMVTEEQPGNELDVVRVPATDMAVKIGDIRVANMVMLGAYCAKRNALAADKIRAYLKTIFTGPKAALVEPNVTALERGRAAVDT